MGRGKGSKLVYIIIIVLGIVAAGLSISGERRRNNVEKDLRSHKNCDSDAASTGFGVVALLLLLFTQIALMVVTSCLCWGRGQLVSGGCCTCSVILLVFSWASFLSAEGSILAATVASSLHNGGHVHAGFSCSDIKFEFIRGGIFAFLTMIFNVFYYMCYTMTPTKKHVERIDPPANPTIGMTPSA
ncbi:uncharacterized protein [Henckelia pumila]|uniref:uncharacterized protein n=1 Tax=Henckelia pumila TaxID=405737 RepID=UPI003C6E7F0F